MGTPEDVATETYFTPPETEEMSHFRKRVAEAMPPVNCETCYLHKPGNYTRKDCVTYGKRPCALEDIYIDAILALLPILNKGGE